MRFTLRRPWDEVLRVTRQVPPSSHDCFSRHLVNRALYHTGRLGEAARTGKSNINPRISPDGRFLLSSMCNHSDFALYQPDSDLYLLNLESGEYWKLECNSEFAESWHSWSSNGRWIIFSSKRPTGIFTWLYLSHIDQAGHASKPFILPQRDPGYYDDLLFLYSVPEFITGPVEASPAELLQAVRDTLRAQSDGVPVGTPQLPYPDPARLRPE